MEMSNDAYIDDERQNEQEAEMYAEYLYAKSQGFIDYVYENRSIGNGDMLIRACEDTQLQKQYIKDAGLPADTELEF
jgi:hypothetical protein